MDTQDTRKRVQDQAQEAQTRADALYNARQGTSGAAPAAGTSTASSPSAAQRSQAGQRLSGTDAAASSALSAARGAQTADAAAYAELAARAQQSAQNNRMQEPDYSDMTDTLNQWRDNATQQSSSQIDYATQQGVRDLAQARNDAYEQYQQQLRQIDADEAKARDTQALYSAARGDRGGIGAAQYDYIAANAAANRQTVYNAQTKLASDTARQVAELRAQGEYKKADAVLSIGQQYLSQIYQQQKDEMQMSLSVAQFNASMDQWLASYLADLNAQNVQAGQWAQSFAYKKSRDAVADQQWQSLFDANRADTAWSKNFQNQQFAYQKERDTVADQQWQSQFDESVRQFTENLNLNWAQYGLSERQLEETIKQWWTNREDTLAQQNWDNNYKLQVLEQDAAQFAQTYGLNVQQFQENVKQWWTARQDNLTQQENENAYRDRVQSFNERSTLTQLDQNQQKINLDQYATAAQISQNQQKIDLDERQISNAERQAAASQAQNAQSANRTTAFNLLDRGIVPNDTILSSIGMDRATAQAYAQAIRDSGGTSGTSGSTSSGKSMTIGNAKDLAKGGVWTDTMYNAFLSNGWTEADIQAAYGTQDGYKSYMAGKNGGTASGGASTTTTAASAGINQSRFNQAMQGISAQMAQGGAQTALNTVTSLWGQMSDAQKKQVQDLFARYGYRIEE